MLEHTVEWVNLVFLWGVGVMKIVKNGRRKCGGLELGNGRRRAGEGSSAGWLEYSASRYRRLLEINLAVKGGEIEPDPFRLGAPFLFLHASSAGEDLFTCLSFLAGAPGISSLFLPFLLCTVVHFHKKANIKR
jgi:hypothetical protein